MTPELLFDYTGRLWAHYDPNTGDRIIHFTDHPPAAYGQPNVMIDQWIRDDGRADLKTIMDKTGRDIVPAKRQAPPLSPLQAPTVTWKIYGQTVTLPTYVPKEGD